MELNKIIARKEANILKGEPSIYEYFNDSETKKIDVLSCKNSIQKGVQAFATIGLNKINIGLTVDEKPLRVELVGACDIKDDVFGNIISNVAFEIMDSEECFPGYIVKDIIGQYVKNTHMKHIFLTTPFLWDELRTISTENEYVTWLMIVPISEKEMRYVEEYSSDKLEDLFEEKQIDIFNLHRESVL